MSEVKLYRPFIHTSLEHPFHSPGMKEVQGGIEEFCHSDSLYVKLEDFERVRDKFWELQHILDSLEKEKKDE